MILNTTKSKIFFIILLLSLSSSLFAQGFYFGRNKVQYTQFNWHILKTKHFDIYYYPEMQDIAEKGAQFAEDAYFAIQSKFNHTILRRIPLIFYSTHAHFQQTNITPGFIPEGVGGFFEFLKGRVVIPNSGNLNQFRKVIWHELVHVFMHSKVAGVLRNNGRINSGVFPPLWYTEGLAEYWSTKWDGQAEMILKDAVLNNYMIPLEDIWRISGTYMMYKIGQAVMEYIAETYGEDKILLLMENIWKHNSFEECFIETIGSSYREFDSQWVYQLKKRYYPLLAENDFSRKISATVVREGYNFKATYFNDNGNPYTVFMANRTGYSSIYMAPLKELRIGENDDSEILIKGEETSDFEAFHLFSSKIDVNNNGILTFGSKSGENDALYIYDIPDRSIKEKYYFDNLVGILSPSWSSDGKKIAFTGLSFEGYKDIYIFDVTTEELTKLTDDSYDDNDPSWSPDGNFIVFSSDRTELGKNWSYNLFLINVNDGNVAYLTYGKQKDAAPVFSPDGKHIAFTSDRDLSLNLYLLELDGAKNPKKEYKITSFANAAFDPEWTPEGGLLFGVYENQRFQIRYLDNVVDFKENAKTYQISGIKRRSRPWQFENLRAEFQIERMKYSKDYDLDIVQSQVSNDPIFGTTGGAQVAFTDIMGNDQYHFLLYNNARSSSELLRSFSFALTKVSLEKRMNYAYGIFRYVGRHYSRLEDDFYSYEDRLGGFIALSYPISQFMRIEYSSSYSYSDRDFIYRRRLAYLTSNFISIVKDNSLWTSSGPIDGERFKFTIGNTFDIKYSNVNYYTIMADYRRYFRLGLRSAYAVRLLFLQNKGREARRFWLGGSWDLRGYPFWSIIGRQVAFTSHEIRFPFIDLLGIRFPFGTIGFPSIRGALFFDAGNAWDGPWQWNQEGLLGSFGLGLRMRFIGYLVFRLDIGKRTDFNQLQDGVFTQFFFGWDF
jgi:Tol biopolymer transport system component